LPVVVFAEAERGNVMRTAHEEQTHAGPSAPRGPGRDGGRPRHPRQARDRRERQ